MTRALRTSRPAYLPLGIIAGGLVVLWVLVWIYRGPQTGAWQPIALVVGFYAVWCLAQWRRVLVIDNQGIRCTYLIGKPRAVAWSEIRRSEIALWIDRKPYQLRVFGSSPAKPLLTIPLRLYDKSDVDFLMALDGLRIEKSAAWPPL
jgi:hypothetical protein